MHIDCFCRCLAIIANLLVPSLCRYDFDRLHNHNLLPLPTTNISAAAAAADTTIASAVLAGRLVVMLFSCNFSVCIMAV
jgi:hypothetical protein